MAVIRFANGLWRLFCLTTPYLFLHPPPPPSGAAHIESVPSIGPRAAPRCALHVTTAGVMGELSQAVSMRQR